jgi:hypothetical protein
LVDAPGDLDQPASQNSISQTIDRFPSKCRKEFLLVLARCLITPGVVCQRGRFSADLSGNKSKHLFVSPSWRYADPRIGLLTGGEWDTARPIICRTLGFTSDPAPVLSTLAQELDQTYRAVAARLPNNSAVRFETVDGRKELVLSPFDKLEEPPSLLALRDAVATRLPRVDLPEILLEIAARTGA